MKITMESGGADPYGVEMQFSTIADSNDIEHVEYDFDTLLFVRAGYAHPDDLTKLFEMSQWCLANLTGSFNLIGSYLFDNTYRENSPTYCSIWLNNDYDATLFAI